MKVKNVYRMVHTMGKTQPGGVRGGTENSDFPGGTDRKKMKSVWKISQAAVCAEKEKMSV